MSSLRPQRLFRIDPQPSSYFTVPQNFSETASKKNHTGFASLVNKANLTNTLDSTSEITIFIPTNEAIHSLPGNITANPSDLTTLLSNHVIKGFAGYLPYLVDGTSYTTSAGSKISILIKNGVYFVDGARIVVPNLITPNGVAHVINQVRTITHPSSHCIWRAPAVTCG